MLQFMKKNLSFLLLLSIFTCCNNPGGRSWIIPVTIDPSDLLYTPVHLESFEMRRSQLLSNLDEGFVILRSNDQSSGKRHKFRPNNCFYYLTGYDAPQSYAVISNHGNHPFTMSLPIQSKRSLIYQGEGLTPDQVQELYRPDRLLSYDEFRLLVDSILQTGAPVYVDRSDRTFYDDLQRRMKEKGNTQIRNLSQLVDELRVFKGSREVDLIQKACDITSRALINVMKECDPGMYEFEIESIIQGTFLQYGAAMSGFPSIVGSGPNSTILHYESKSRQMESGDLLLMDIGAEYGYYSADITRTIPVNGRFSNEQRTIYQLVLDAQLAAIDSLKPGNRLGDGHMAAREVIVDGLLKLGLMTDSSSAWQMKLYMPHQSSHFLGLDVHDVGNDGGFLASAGQDAPGKKRRSRQLEPGMVLTIEPGIYFREKGLEQLYKIYRNETDSTEIAEFIEQVGPIYEKYINIGVRIEDDILITKEGNINLSRYAPKEIDDIEQIMR